ncbi:LuxR family transcriptional regulator [Streptomyces sp. NPDC054847]
MANSKIDEALRRLGLGADATRVYQALLEVGPAPMADVASACGLAGSALSAAYAELVDAGFASAVGSDQDVVAPVPPATGLQVLGRQRAAELDASRVAVAGAFDAFRRQRLTEYNEGFVEVVTGEAVGPRIRQAWVSAREQIRQFDTPPYFPIDTAFDDAMETLSRGVRQRVIYSRAALEVPGYLAEIEPFFAAGEQRRVLPSLPVKLVIIDEAYALVSLSISEADVHNTVVIVQPCGLFSALIGLFEQSWELAIPFHGGDPQPQQRLLPADRRLLSLLAAGVADDVIAREIGVSRRTLFRRMEILMTRLGARTRFQMALQAERRGWL